MKEHITHHGKESEVPEVVETYKEEGALTLETLDVATHNAMSDSHKKHTKKSFTLTTPMAIIVASIIIAGGLLGYGLITQGGTKAAPKEAFKGKAVTNADYVEGKTTSKIVVIEYSDPECPFCAQVSPTIKKLRTEYADKVAFVYRHFPLIQIHQHAFDESRAIACAGKIGGTAKFYEYIDTLYGYKVARQSTALPATGKEDFAQTIGLDKDAFSTCMKDNQTAQIVTDSINDGTTAGVQGTPATFVLVKTKKGYDVVSMVDGARPEEYFKTVIEEALAR